MITVTRRSEIERVFEIKLAGSRRMDDALELWRRMYEDDPIWCDGSIEPIGLPAAIAEEHARMTTLDIEVDVTGSPMAEFLDEVIQRQIDKAKDYTELVCAKGAVAMKPYYSPSKNTIEITNVQADEFYPTRFDSNGQILGAVFIDQMVVGEYVYTRLERHELIGTTYGIENKVFYKKVLDTGDGDYLLGDECLLSDVDVWKDIKPITIIQNIKKPLFAYFKVPMSNTIEPHSPLGVSVYSRGWKRIKRCDLQWAKICWEYDATEAAILADEDMFIKNRNGDLALEKKDKRLYRTLDGFKDQIKEFAPAIRDQSLFNGLNQMLRKVEFQSCLAYGTLSDNNEVEKTAEEFKASKNKAVTFVGDMQKAFQKAHNDLLEAVRTMAVLYGLCPDGAYEVAYNFDESLAINRSEAFKELMQLAAAGMIRPEYVTSWYFGITEEEAAKMLPEPFDETTEGTVNLPPEE